MNNPFDDPIPPTRGVLYLVARENAYVYQALTLYERGDLTWDDMLLRLVLVLVDQNAHLENELKDRISREPPAPIIFELKNR